MAVTRVNGQKRIVEGSVVEALLADSAVTNAKIADSAVTAVKVDATDNYTFAQVTATDAVTLQSTLEVDDVATLKADLSAEQNATIGGDLSVSGNGTITGDVVISGNLQVDGDQIIANTSTLDVEDKNITVNKGGAASTMDGSGLTVDNSDDATQQGSLVFDSNLTSKWKLGIIDAEVEVVAISGSQTLTDKTYNLVGDAIEDQDNLEDALRALDDKVNEGTAYKVQEGDTSSTNYNSDENRWETGEAIVDSSPVHVYMSGLRLRSGTKDSSGNISNDYAIDYANGYVEFAETADGNITVEYIPAS